MFTSVFITPENSNFMVTIWKVYCLHLSNLIQSYLIPVSVQLSHWSFIWYRWHLQTTDEYWIQESPLYLLLMQGMELGIKGRVAFVGGASRGLGFAVANALADAGCKLAICSRNQDRLNEATSKLKNKTEVLAIQADLSKKHDINRVIEEVNNRFGGVDILVSNTGGPRAADFFHVNDEDWYYAFDLLFMSAWRLTRAFIDGMKQKNWGRIIYLTSLTVKQPIDHLILSNAIRLAIVGMAKTLSADVARYGITVNCIATGMHKTERIEDLLKSQSQRLGVPIDEFAKQFLAQIPAGRLGEPSELADLVAFLASERAAFITGTTIQIDGGQVKYIL